MDTLADKYYLKAVDSYPHNLEESVESLTLALSYDGEHVGANYLMDCHNEDSRMKIREIMTTHQKNVYTIEKRGRKKIIYQAPWMDGNVFKGIVELSLEIPFEMPHYKRD